MLGYVSMLRRWNDVHNLSAARDPQTLVQSHILDCLAVVPALTRQLGGGQAALLDAGAGAGLPAVIVAIMRPKWLVTAVDSVGKKVAFLRQVAGELGLQNLYPLHARLESLRAEQQMFDLITARALGSLRNLVELTSLVIKPSGSWAAMKGVVPEEELNDLPTNCELFHVERLSVPGLSAARSLIWLRPVPPGAH